MRKLREANFGNLKVFFDLVAGFGSESHAMDMRWMHTCDVCDLIIERERAECGSQETVVL